jgi:hypothetical protein
VYQTASQIHGINTRCKLDSYYPHSSLTVHQKGPYYFGIKLFNHLRLTIKELVHDNKQFRKALSVFLHSKSFCTIEEYFSQGLFSFRNVIVIFNFIMSIIIVSYILKFSVNFILLCDVLICNFVHYVVDTAVKACILYNKFCIQMALTCMDLLERAIKMQNITEVFSTLQVL